MNLPELLEYCAALDKNNNREWFRENHEWYDRARASFSELLEQLRFAVCSEAPLLADDIMYMPVREWTYRVPRDMRIRRDVPPYNPSFRAYISRDRRSSLPIGYYICLKPGESCFGTGLWCPEPGTLSRVRSYICGSWRDLDRLAAEYPGEIGGERLKRAPRGYTEDEPAAHWLRHKAFTLLRDVPDAAASDADALCAFAADRIREMEPLRQYLLRAAGQCTTQKKLMEDFYRFDTLE